MAETRAQELARGWPTVLAAATGVGLGVAGLLTYNSGLFAHDLAIQAGVSRTMFGAAFFGSTLTMAIAMPWVGWLVDRYGPRRVATLGAIALSSGFLALAHFVHSPVTFLVIMALVGFFAALSSPVPYTRAVSGAFDRGRGLALGLTQVGIGIAAAVVPPTITLVIVSYGWRHGYHALAAIALLGVVPALAGLPGKDLGQRDRNSGSAFPAVRRSTLFKVQLAAFVTMALAFAGMLAHFVPMLRDAGLPMQKAGVIAGAIGISVIVTRVVVGWLADRVEPAWLGAACCALCAVGCLTLALGGPSFALVGAISLGAAMGAEADLVGILTARYFGIAAYSRAYAVQYAAFMLAAGVSPLWIGYSVDASGGYQLPLIICASFLIIPILLFLQLPKLQRSTKWTANLAI